MLDHERVCWAEGVQRLAGVDEAGRGPWAGPVVAAAVVIEPAFAQTELNGLLRGLNDSKKLTPQRREFFFELLQQRTEVAIGVGQASVAEIDELNILRATHLAMARALAALQPPADFALVDGLPVKGLPCPHRAIVRGDSLSLSIAAASIIAKVTRDRQMLELDREFPAYGFAAHKGYGTEVHQRALRTLGVTPHHRRSFRPIRELLGLENPT
ncbi:MAG: ribonuclease HII [Verrucomicrobia bacterium]|nr:MAG: ribonuclease HII [Verrucomicrobiota bacterium]